MTATWCPKLRESRIARARTNRHCCSASRMLCGAVAASVVDVDDLVFEIVQSRRHPGQRAMCFLDDCFLIEARHDDRQELLWLMHLRYLLGAGSIGDGVARRSTAASTAAERSAKSSSEGAGLVCSSSACHSADPSVAVLNCSLSHGLHRARPTPERPPITARTSKSTANGERRLRAHSLEPRAESAATSLHVHTNFTRRRPVDCLAMALAHAASPHVFCGATGDPASLAPGATGGQY